MTGDQYEEAFDLIHAWLAEAASLRHRAAMTRRDNLAGTLTLRGSLSTPLKVSDRSVGRSCAEGWGPGAFPVVRARARHLHPGRESAAHRQGSLRSGPA